jgi:hypothetical protein
MWRRNPQIAEIRQCFLSFHALLFRDGIAMPGRCFSQTSWISGFALVGLLLAVGCAPQADSAADSAPLASATVAVPNIQAESAAASQDDLLTAPSRDAVAASGATDQPNSSDAFRVVSRPPSELYPAPDSQRAGATGDSANAPQDESKVPLFVGWPEPEAVLFLTGQQHGYIEPCGCTGLVNQKGGLNRRYTFAQELRERGWEVIPLDVGNQVRRFGRQAEIKFQMTTYGMKKMGYQAIGFGVDDLRLSAMHLFAETAAMGDEGTPFVSANASVYDPTAIPSYQIIELSNGKKIGVTAVVGAEWYSKINSSDIGLQDPVESLTKLQPDLQKQGCQMWVLLAHASLEESRRLAEKFPLFDVVVTAGGLGDPLYQPDRIPGSDTLLVQVGIKGMYVGILGIFHDARTPLRYQRVPLDERFKDSREMMQLLASYQEQLKTLGLEQLGLRPLPHPSGRTYIGSEACADCHSTAYEIWEGTRHSHALDSLVNPGERSEVPRHFDPECISCHVIGWEPQKYFPYTSGYLALEETPSMQHVGCENCHGPGAEHVAAEHGDADLTDEQIDSLRRGMRLTLEDARKEQCMTCHDLDNSPAFHEEGAFERYWEKVLHDGLD